MSTTLVRLDGVKARTGLSRSEIYRRIAASAFPQPIIIHGTRIRAWTSDSIDQWVEETVAASPRLDGTQP